MHYIRYDVLYEYVLSRVQYWTAVVQQDEGDLLNKLLNDRDSVRDSVKQKQLNELKNVERRKKKVDNLFIKLYEDWSAGRITDYNFNMLSEKYQKEQKELDEKILILKQEMERAMQTEEDVAKWIELIKKYANPSELTAELLNALIDKIVVHEATKDEDGNRVQEVEIFYRFIGKID